MIGAFFVDGASISISLTQQGQPLMPKRIDYDRLPIVVRAIIREREKLPEPIEWNFKNYYVAYKGDDDRGKDPFIEKIKKWGWSVQEFMAKHYRDGTWRDKQVDIALALDAYDVIRSGSAKVIVMGTHDSDFAALMKKLPGSVLKYVVGWSDMMARELREVAKPIYLDEIYQKIKYNP